MADVQFSWSTAAIVASSLAGAVSGAVLDLPVTIQNGYKTVSLNIGTPGQTYRLLFDTGSTSTWVVDNVCRDTCSNASGYKRVGYDIKSSSTGKYTGQDASIDYLGGGVAGLTVTDEFAVGDLSWNQAFIAANESNWAALAADGFFGFAFGSIADGGAAPIFETLMEQKLVDEPKFGIYYDQNVSDSEEGTTEGEGLLTLGGSRQDRYAEEEVTAKFPILRPSAGFDVWRTNLYSIEGKHPSGNGTTVKTLTDMHWSSAVFDTGASSISLPPDQLEPVYASIGMNWTAIIGGQHIPLCSEFTDAWSVTLSVGNFDNKQSITLTGDQLKVPGFANREDACWPPFDDSGASYFSLLGVRLLRNFYTVWDYGSNPYEDEYYKPTLSFSKLKK